MHLLEFSSCGYLSLSLIFPQLPISHLPLTPPPFLPLHRKSLSMGIEVDTGRKASLISRHFGFGFGVTRRRCPCRCMLCQLSPAPAPAAALLMPCTAARSAGFGHCLEPGRQYTSSGQTAACRDKQLKKNLKKNRQRDEVQSMWMRNLKLCGLLI